MLEGVENVSLIMLISQLFRVICIELVNRCNNRLQLVSEYDCIVREIK